MKSFTALKSEMKVTLPKPPPMGAYAKASLRKVRTKGRFDISEIVVNNSGQFVKDKNILLQANPSF